MRTRCEAAESEIDSESTRLRALMLAEVGRAVALRKFFCISSLMSRARARLARPSITQNLSASPRAPAARKDCGGLERTSQTEPMKYYDLLV